MFEIENINNQVLAYGALKNDLLFHKIPKEKYKYYIDESLKIGREKAMLLKQYSIEQLCQENHIMIKYAKQDGKFYGVRFRANIEMSENEKKIILYKDSLDEIAKASQIFLQKNITVEDVINIHLAHELFHFYEYMDKQPTNEKLESIVRIKIGPKKFYSTVMSTCEIAAHAFAKEFLGLEFLPNLFDYLLLVEQGEMNLDKFKLLLKQWKEEIGE